MIQSPKKEESCHRYNDKNNQSYFKSSKGGKNQSKLFYFAQYVLLQCHGNGQNRDFQTTKPHLYKKLDVIGDLLLQFCNCAAKSIKTDYTVKNIGKFSYNVLGNFYEILRKHRFSYRKWKYFIDLRKIDLIFGLISELLGNISKR